MVREGSLRLPCTTVTLHISSINLHLLGKPPQPRSVARAGVQTAQVPPHLCTIEAAQQDVSELCVPCSSLKPTDPEGNGGRPQRPGSS